MSKYTKQKPSGLAKPFNITSVCKLDMISVILDTPKYRRPFTLTDIKKLTEADMRNIAQKMSDDYLNQLFWSSLENIVEDYIKNKKTCI